MITRYLDQQVRSRLYQGKAIILFGARQTGKTTLLMNLVSELKDVTWLNGDDLQVRSFFEQGSIERFKAAFAKTKVLVIDEAQYIADIGLRIKLITDHLKGIQVIATGSSAFELANQINEPMTGRKWEFHLFPLSFSEMKQHHGLVSELSLIPHRLVYGYYPEIVTHPGEEKDILKSLTDSYLFKDILQWERIRKPDKLLKLLQALSFQIGNEVSYSEIGQIADLDPKTVENYILLLEQTHVIFRLGSFSKNLRNELKMSRKIYFYDTGIRNALISNFQIPELRQDIGALWENFLIAERKKWIQESGLWCNTYFWRTHDQQEIDYIEEKDGRLFAFEFKWSPAARARFSKTFTRAYPENTIEVISRDNFDSFVSGLEQ